MQCGPSEWSALWLWLRHRWLVPIPARPPAGLAPIAACCAWHKGKSLFFTLSKAGTKYKMSEATIDIRYMWFIFSFALIMLIMLINMDN